MTINEKISMNRRPFEIARTLITEFKGDEYVFGTGVLKEISRLLAGLEGRAVLIHGNHAGIEALIRQVEDSLTGSDITLAGKIDGARPNAPREDLARITEALRAHQPDLIVSLGGGSTIDCVKAAEVLRTLGGDIGEYFGTGLVSATRGESGKQLTPHLAIQTAAGSAAHLTKYSNITDLQTAQKKLLVDDALVPDRAVFDYAATMTVPAALTIDGALDGFSHALEVFYGATGSDRYGKIETVARTALSLIVRHLPHAVGHPENPEAREALGLATDLGGYAIMLGGTNGGHLTSFSLVDVLTHGRACGLLNPYYTVFFAPAIQSQLRVVGGIFREAGYIGTEIGSLAGDDLGRAVAEAMMAFYRRLGVPASLEEVADFSEDHIRRALTAAKNPQLKMKLENMPVPLAPEMIEEYMGPILRAAATGDLDLIKTV